MLQTRSNWKIDSTKNEKQWTAEQKWSAKNIQREGILLEQVHNLATIKIMTRLLKKKRNHDIWCENPQLGKHLTLKKSIQVTQKFVKKALSFMYKIGSLNVLSEPKC